jgi:hypothetical protein
MQILNSKQIYIFKTTKLAKQYSNDVRISHFDIRYCLGFSSWDLEIVFSTFPH